MVSTRRSGKSTDKSTDKSRDEDPASLRLDEREEQRDGVEGVGRQGGENNDSGDEMPEEVTFATGKQSAVHRRQQETRAKRHIQEEAKERRRKRQNKREVERKEEEEEEEGAVNVEPQASDMLAPDVLEALVRAEEEDELVRDRRLSEQRVVTEQLRNVGNAPLSKRVVFPEERSVGPVTVRLIKPGHRQKASEAAKDFLKGKLYESIHRSDEMLYPTRGQQLLRLRK